MNLFHSLIYGAFVLWLLWSLVRDGLPVLALKDSKRHGKFIALVALFHAYALVAAIALPLLGKFDWGPVAGLISTYLLALVVMEYVGARFRKEIKVIGSGKSGLKMPYRAPVSVVLLVGLALIYPENPAYSIALPLVVLMLLGILGKRGLVGAEYHKPEVKAKKN